MAAIAGFGAVDQIDWRDRGGAGDPRLSLAECLATRLCHDMAGLIGTISGTLEMALGEVPEDDEAACLAVEAAAQLAGRVRIYRAAWGGGEMAAEDIATLAEGLPNRSRLNLAIDPALVAGVAAGRLPETAPRLLLCLLLAATAGLPAGGDITVCAMARGFAMTLVGRNAAWPAELAADADALGGFVDAADARRLAAPMAALVGAAGGWRLALDGRRLTAVW